MTALRAAALAALAAVAVYWGTLDHGFVWDDHIHIEAAPFVQDSRNLGVLASPGFWRGRVRVEGSGRPLLLASLLLDRAAWGDLAAGYHLTNVVLHAGAAAALTLFAASVTASPPAALLTGLLFAVHPVQTEAVCGVSFRADVLAALFVFLALLLARRAHGARSAAWTTAACAAFALALLSKESALVLPALAWLAEWIAPPRESRAKLKWIQLAAFLAVLAAYAGFRAPRGGYGSLADSPPAAAHPAAAPREVALAAHARATTPARPAEAAHAAARPAPAAPSAAEAPTRSRQYDPSPPPWKAALTSRGARARAMLSVFLDYARLSVWPAGLQADRSPVLDERLAARALAGAAAGVAIIVMAAWARRRLPAASLGLAWFLVALVPVSGLSPLPNLIAERYLYLPLAGLCLAAAAALAAVARRAPRPALALACAAAALLAGASMATLKRVPAWRDDTTLFAGRVLSDGSRLRYNRALLARRSGDFKTARAEYEKALALNPGSIEAMVNLSEVEASLGKPDEELALLRRAVALNPRSAIAQEALGHAFENRGLRKEALAAYNLAVRFDYGSPTARVQYARALAWSGRLDVALEVGAITATLDPNNAQLHYTNGRFAQEGGRFDRAEDSFRRAVKIDSKHALAWANLGVCLHRRGKLAEALGAMRTAIRLLPGSADLRRNLGALLDDLKREREAVDAFAEAVRLDDGSAAGWHGYGVVLQKSKNTAQAVRAYERALTIDPNKVESKANLSALRAAMSASDRVEYARLLASDEVEAKHAHIHYANGRIAQDAGRFAQAAQSFRLATRADPNNGLAWANLGACLHRDGKLDEALAAMREAIRLMPDQAEPQRNLGALLDDLGREREAETAYAAAVRLDSASALGWHGYGVVLQKLGDAPKAARAYERALEIEPSKVESLVNLSGLRLKLGDLDGAGECLAKAIAARPEEPGILRAIEFFERMTGRVVRR